MNAFQEVYFYSRVYKKNLREYTKRRWYLILQYDVT